MVLICIEKATASHFAFLESRVFAVHTLSEHQRDLSEHFATPFSDKFTGLGYRIGIGGIPVLSDSLTAMECRIVNSFDGGDHSIFVGEVESSAVNDAKPLVYFRGDYRRIEL